MLASVKLPVVVIRCCHVFQIHAECKRFGKAYSLRSVAVYGGGSMWEQAKALQEGAEIVVCTPVRQPPPQLLPASHLDFSLSPPPS